jgi:hypothetical protein
LFEGIVGVGFFFFLVLTFLEQQQQQHCIPALFGFLLSLFLFVFIPLPAWKLDEYTFYVGVVLMTDCRC